MAPKRPPIRHSSRDERRDRIPLSDVQVGDCHDGAVVTISRHGVFVDFGAVKDGLLRTTNREFHVGDPVRVTVYSCDLESSRVQLELAGAAPSQSHRPLSRPRKKEAGSLNMIVQRDTAPDGRARVPLEELQPNVPVRGVVKNVGQYGTFFDIGAEGDARLASGTRRFRRGDVVDLLVDWVDTTLRRIQVSLASPAEDAREAPVQEHTAKEVSVVDTFRVGQYVNGTVHRVALPNIFVNIGAIATLSVVPHVARQLRRGDELYGMRIDALDRTHGRIEVSLDDPQLEMPKAEWKPWESWDGWYSWGWQAEWQEKDQSEWSDAQSSGPHHGHLRVGGFVDGTVTRVTSKAVYVDIGVGIDGFLAVPRSLAAQFLVDDQIKDMTVDHVHHRTGRVHLSINDPKLETGERDF